MNKALFLLIFFCSFGYAQKLVVTPDGFRNEVDTEKAFVVINVEGQTAKQLYDAALKYIHKTYQNPDSAIKGNITDEYIKFVTHATNFITIKNSFVNTPFSTDYTCELSFKDGKVRFEIPSIVMYDKGDFKLSFKGQGAFSGYFIYNNKNELKRKDAKEFIENYFNIQIENIWNSLLNKTDEKW